MTFLTLLLTTSLLSIVLFFIFSGKYIVVTSYRDVLLLSLLPLLIPITLFIYSVSGWCFLDFIVSDVNLYAYCATNMGFQICFDFIADCLCVVNTSTLYVGYYIYLLTQNLFFFDVLRLWDSFLFFICMWWPWLCVFNDVFFVQFFILCVFTYIYMYYNIYFTLLYVGLGFFLLGIYLSIFQLELFTAFLWLVECSVLFVFLLFLFFLNVKGVFNYVYVQSYQVWVFIFFLFFFLLLFVYFDSNNHTCFLIQPFNVVENYYEAFVNTINNDLFVFVVSYYFLNVVEFLIIGFILLVGSVICVNLYQMNRNVRTQSYFGFLNIFNFLVDFSSFYFFRRQNVIKQGNAKAALKFFKKK